MIRALLSVRFRALLAGLTAQGRKKKKKSTGMMVLFAILYVYLLAVIAGLMCVTFYPLAQAYHAIGLDWLYFSVAGLMALALSVIGSVFTTQSQLYDAKDNEMLLSMPIPPRTILLSRMVPLLALNLLFSGIVMVPAMVMYAIGAECSLSGLLCQFLAWLAVCLLAQAIACLLGWLLHLLLRRMNKSLASLLYMVVFLGVYFAVYSQAGNILQSMALNGQVIASALQTWVWPLYAMGLGSLGKGLYLLLFLLICAAVFGVVYWVLSATFLHAATSRSSSHKRRKLNMEEIKVSSPIRAILGKELRKFLGCPVYLTNMGLGVILTLALPIAGIIFKSQLLPMLALLGGSEGFLPLIICAMLTFAISTSDISTPSVSLEGKNLWILRSMPVASRDILKAKLYFHILMTVPVSMLSGLVLSITYGCSIADIVLTTIIPGLLALFTGLVGLWAGLMWAKLDYISEAYPCKQSVSVLVAMFAPWSLAILLGVSYIFLSAFLSPTAFLVLCALVLSGLCFVFYRIVTSWGAKKWESLQA